MKELHLLWYDDCDSLESDVVTLHTLEPLFNITKLRTFEIFHRFPLALDLQDMETLACRIPAIENLTLNDEPGKDSKSELTLLALLPFARHCPSLKSLGLFIDARAMDTPSLDQIHPFHSLRELAVGSFLIAEAPSAALFLGYIFPSGCRVKAETSWSINGLKVFWNKVNDVSS